MWPSAASESRSSRKFSTIPLRTTATSSSAQPVSGCAFSYETFPWVAQRVWPTPVVDWRSVRPGGFLQLVEVSDGANVLETLVFDETEPGRVIAAVLESLEPLQQKVLSQFSSPRIQ